MIKRKFHSNIWKWVLGIILLIVLVIGGVSWYISRSWKPLLDSQLRSLVVLSSDSLYHIEYSDLQLNLLTGNATVTDFKLIPDTAVYQRLLQEKKAPDNLYNLSVDKIAIRNFHPRQLYTQKKLDVNNILVDNPTLVITNRRQPYNDTIPAQKPKSLYQSISKIFKEVRINSINLNDIDFTFINKSNRPVKTTAIRNLTINIDDVLVDSLSENDKNRFYTTKRVDVLMKDYQIATPDSLYYIKFNNIRFSTEGRKLSLDKFSLVSRYNTKDFYKKVGYNKDKFNIAFNGISIRGIDLRKFTRDQKFYANSLNIANALVEVYSNNSYPKRRTVKKGKFPHQLLQRLALDLKVDTLNLHKTKISYAEYEPASGATGIITFNDTRGKFYNVTNDSAALAKNHFMKANITSHVLNSGTLDVHFNFNLTDKLGAFTYSGTLAAMDGRALNKITVPLGMLKVNTADIKRLEFDARANEIAASGKMKFYYNNLNVNVLQRDKETGNLKKQGFVSAIANVVIINKDNPSEKGVFTPGTIYYKRDPTASFFSLLWKSLFSGIKESVGVSADREKRLRNTVADVGNFVGKVKQKYQDFKEKRQEKREERKQKREQRRQEKAAEKAAKDSL
ncbi:hypothetical protein FW774_00795 (plasmid) [Pedobacter sp. BS3]|uniref:hypothetical protein n=1 Tax=Pedobacter sp. BS3 TaxID=2567937 RepID=UPI0011EF7B12|nr:hypothetical protein [Pedobacter sp. BS3]TZF85648.1 hypothetical protein FW774_00795 [Pedobacter sp. BS3]